MSPAISTQIVSVPGLDSLPFAIAVRENPWLLDALQIGHLLGISLLIGTVFAFDLRVLGINKRVPVQYLARHLLPLTLTALVLVVPTGLAMFAAHASELLTNRLFGLKMSLILAGAINALIFHSGPYRSVTHWSRRQSAPVAARLCAALSILGWSMVLVCGHALYIR